MEKAIKTKERTPIDVDKVKERVEREYPFERLSESIRNKPKGVPLTNAEALEFLRWAQARWDVMASEAGLR